nr:probable LRR receptor-like serine/threonine-protein kinase At5g48740 [Tanacetum cinerariifolium]
PESKKWLNAMNVEMQSMKDNEVWVLFKLPPNGKTVGRIDYEETFSPIRDIRAIRILIAIAAYYDYEIWQMDVKIAFLNGYLNEEVYMEQPEGFVNLKYLNREKLKLSKSQGASTPAKMKRIQNVPYALAVGSVMYAVRCTRPDVTNTKDMFLVYEEAEYIAAFDASKEAVWVRKFISGLSVVPIIEEPISMFEQQPKKFLNPKILLLNSELELKSGKRKCRDKVDPLQYQPIVDAEWNIIYDKLDKCVKNGAKIIMSRLAIGDLATHYFADLDIFCGTCGTVLTFVNNVIDEVLRSCEVFEEKQHGNERFNIYSGCPSAERILHDAIMIVRRAMKNSTVVGAAGGGAIDISGKSQLFINAFALLDRNWVVAFADVSLCLLTNNVLMFRVSLLSSIHHPNLVSLEGYCHESKHQILVYKYLPGGTLTDNPYGINSKIITLSWVRRLKIAIDAAKGLYYLHNRSEPQIIHRDMKSSNILLDGDLNAKVCDFGLSKQVLQADESHVTTMVKGSAGYLDPEYYITQQLTEKSDIYSFGVVLLDLICGRAPLRRIRSPDSFNLVLWLTSTMLHVLGLASVTHHHPHDFLVKKSSFLEEWLKALCSSLANQYETEHDSTWNQKKEGNPLYLHANDSNCLSIYSVKLIGVDNYRIWASAMKLALQIKHKMGFINGTCVRTDYLASASLLEQWDRCNAVVLNWILSSLSQDVYLGHVFSSNAATRRIPRGIPSSSGTVKTEKAQATAFVSKQSDMNRSRNNNWSNNGNNVNIGVYDSLLCKNCSLKGHTIDRCFELIGCPPGFKRNPNLKPNTNGNSKNKSGDLRKGSSTGQSNMAGANQHMTNSIKDVVNLVDFSDLKLTVGHPNGTLAKITHVGNFKLNNDVMLFDVLVILEYTVSLVSVHKFIKDSKFSVGFNETKCYIQGLEKGRVLGIGSEFGGLYLFDKEYNKSTIANNSSLNLSNIDHEGPCEHMHAPLKSHFDIALRLLKYLKLAPGFGVQFVKRQNDFDTKAFFDSDLAKCPITRRNLLPAELYCDNKAAMQITANPVMHEKTKHFDLDVHFIREKVCSGLIKTVKVESKENVADILTKALGSFQHDFLTKSLV